MESADMAMTADYTDTETRQPIDTPPASLEAACAEREALFVQLSTINGQLGEANKTRNGQRLDAHEYWEWRRRALSAKRYTERRYRFVKQWIAQQHAATRTQWTPPNGGSPATADLKALAKRVGAIEAIAVAAVAYVREGTPDAYEELARVVMRASEQAGI